MLCNSHAEGCDEGEDCANEDGTTTTDPVVQGIRNPPGTIEVSEGSTEKIKDLQERDSNVRA